MSGNGEEATANTLVEFMRSHADILDHSAEAWYDICDLQARDQDNWPKPWVEKTRTAADRMGNAAQNYREAASLLEQEVKQ
jgi:hypothetical protein